MKDAENRKTLTISRKLTRHLVRRYETATPIQKCNFVFGRIRMIVARIEGGLGNQIFQYAFGTQLATLHGTELVLDLSSYSCKPEHGYLLDRFSIGAREIRPDERKRIPGRYRLGKRSLLQTLSFGGNELRRLRERPFGFADKYMSSPDDSYLVGYWQSECFFRDVTANIRSQFRPAVALSPESSRIRDRMLNSSSIAIHLRRGDYITTQPMAARNLSLNYYRECVLKQLEHRSDSEVYVFSNDIPWCRKNLMLPCPIHFIEHTNNNTAYEDMWLMTAAECLVIANSTFSWWGAYLAERHERKVYAPTSWFHPNTMDDRFLNCDDWIPIGEQSLQGQAA